MRYLLSQKQEAVKMGSSSKDQKRQHKMHSSALCPLSECRLKFSKRQLTMTARTVILASCHVT